jgi:tripartite-type tricarboxylate transporter receptor subunit TctC
MIKTNVYFRSGSRELSVVLAIPNGTQQNESRPVRSRRGSSYLTPAMRCPINQGAWTGTRARQTCRNPRKVSVIAAVLLAIMTAPSMAQSVYPSRSIQIIVPFTAGGGNDLVARMLADKLQKRWGQPVIVENKPGAGGNIGTEAMLRMPADGYTLLLATNTMTIQAHLFKATPFNVKTDFAPLGKIATTPFALVVTPEKIPANDVAGLLSYIKANPGRLSYASVGVGTPHHLGMEWFKAVTGLDVIHVPYRGTAPALADMVAGHTQLMFVTVAAVTGLIEKGQLRALATPENKRRSTLPDVPTLAEAGVPGIEFSSWYGLLAKAGTPTAIQQKLSEALLEIINEADTKDKIVSAGFELSPDGPQETQRLLNEDLDKWGAIIKKIGLKPE